MSDILHEKIFFQYGFDIGVSVEDSFSLSCLGGILFLNLSKPDGTVTTARRIVVDEDGNTEPFDISNLTRSDKEKLVRTFIKLGTSHADITRHLGLSSSYIGNMMRNKGV